MRTLDEIKKLPNFLLQQVGQDGGCGYLFIDKNRPNKPMVVVWSNGGGWEHVSASWRNRVPTWDEMCKVKDMFFTPEEWCIEYHPAQSEYVNTHPYCLHIWRPIAEKLPTPPSWMVGIKDGENARETFERANKELDEMEKKHG